VTIRIGVIGPGLIWHKQHRPVLEGMGSRASITAICARNQRTLDEARVPEAARYTQIEDLLRDASVDAVMVLTPIALNTSTAIAALRAGKHVFLEKPVATGVEQARALLAAEASSDRRIYVLEQAAYSGRFSALQKLVAERRLGDLILYDRIDHGMLDADKNDAGGYGKTAWRQEADFPLGMLFDGGIHAIAELTQLFGIPEAVFASGSKWRANYGEYDHILMQFRYASGLRGVYSHCAALPWVHCGLTVRGTEGIARPVGDCVELTNLDSVTQKLPVNPNTHALMWEQILDAYERGAPPPYTSLHAVQDVAILEAVSKAIRSGGEEPIAKMS
jgi:scyllo-inositol 2-dehydrogenase (NADP+)